MSGPERSKQAVSCDVLIVGGGLVGSVLANALARIPVDTVLVESRAADALSDAGFDARVTALANGSQRILTQLGLWPAADAAPIRSIHISERGRFGAARIEARDEGVDALGYTVENAALARAFWSGLNKAQRLRCMIPARLCSFREEADCIVADVQTGGRRIGVRTKLLVAADGASSGVRALLGIPVRLDEYRQRALIVNCTTEAAPDGRAFERFTPSGPLAFLPLTGGRMSVVWTLDAAGAERTAALDEPSFRGELQRSFGYRLGRIRRVGRRGLHDLKRIRSLAVCRGRALLIGNAAVNLHPVAGQGFNLALRDVAVIAQLIADAVRQQGAAADPGAPALLARYRAERIADQRRVAAFTHGLIRCFGLAAPGAGVARGFGLLAFDLIPGAKAWLAQQTMGRGGTLPRLARGLDL